MMATIVISYRREDSKWIAGRIFDRLESRYGKGHVFMDIDSIPFGLDFRDHIRETLDRCDIMLAIIGPNWAGKEAAGEYILDETDWVRIEIETALKKKIPLIPVLVDRPKLPKPSELPEGLKDLAFRQAAGLNSELFHSHMDKVIASIDQHLAKLNQPGSSLTLSPAAAPSPSPPAHESSESRVDRADQDGKDSQAHADTSIASADQHSAKPERLPATPLPPRATDSGSAPLRPTSNREAAAAPESAQPRAPLADIPAPDSVNRKAAFGAKFEAKYLIILIPIFVYILALILSGYGWRSY